MSFSLPVLPTAKGTSSDVPCRTNPTSCSSMTSCKRPAVSGNGWVSVIWSIVQRPPSRSTTSSAAITTTTAAKERDAGHKDGIARTRGRPGGPVGSRGNVGPSCTVLMHRSRNRRCQKWPVDKRAETPIARDSERENRCGPLMWSAHRTRACFVSTEALRQVCRPRSICHFGVDLRRWSRRLPALALLHISPRMRWHEECTALADLSAPEPMTRPQRVGEGRRSHVQQDAISRGRS